MRILIFVVTLLLLSINIMGQITSSTQNAPDFNKFITGVKYAHIYREPKIEEAMETKTIPEIYATYNALKRYLEDLGFEYVVYSSDRKVIEDASTSECDIATFWLILDEKAEYGKIHLQFLIISCNTDTYVLDTNPVQYSGYGLEERIYNSLKQAYPKRYSYSKYNRLKLQGGESTGWTENSMISYFSDKKDIGYEGIYEKITGDPKYKLGLVKTKSGYDLVYLKGAMSHNSEDWKVGDLKCKLEYTATNGLFKGTWYGSNKNKNENVYINFTEGAMNVVIDGEKDAYLKLFPIQNPIDNRTNLNVSGTGFAISSDGYIATNYHVIENAKKIRIIGVNGVFDKVYNAKVVSEDKNNDLAILKIIEDNINIGVIPYALSDKFVDVGTQSFVLGYPLRATMGDDIKLTNGIVSSRSGYQGDITAYQISAPVQSGNSGGPVFNSNGELIAVVNAKHIGAENASYAIKSSYLKILADNSNIKLNSYNSLNGKLLVEQVKVINKFVYIIEVEN